MVIQQAAIFPQQPFVCTGSDAVPFIEVLQQVFFFLFAHKTQAYVQVVCQCGKYIQKTQGGIVLPFITIGKINVGYEKHDMTAQHADVCGQRRLLFRIFHLGENIE